MVINNIDINIQQIQEHEITEKQHQAIQALLQQAFPSYPKNRSYFHQIPSFRYLVWHNDELIAHLGVNHRVISLNNELASIFGVMDLCVKTDFQSNKIAARLITRLEKLSHKSNIDFLVLVAEQHDFYLNNGFKLVKNTARWLMVHQRASFGIAQRKLDDCLMIKSINGKSWEKGTVDFLGAMF